MPKAPPRKTADTAKAARPASHAPARPTPAGRLGEDAAPRLPREPLSIVVARTDVLEGEVRLRGEAPPTLRAAVGQVVHVKHAYRLQEHSSEREEYRFLLRSRLGGREHPPSLARLGDQWGIPDDIGGYLQHEHTLSAPGRHVLEFEAGAEYCVMGWGDTTVQSLDRKELDGRIEIVVG